MEEFFRGRFLDSPSFFSALSPFGGLDPRQYRHDSRIRKRLQNETDVMTLSVTLITLNEAANIGPCLEGLRWADEIIVVDGGSTDDTVALAKKFTRKVYSIPFTDFSTQKNAALDRASGDWIFLIDADERVSEPLAEEIRAVVRENPVAVCSVKRETYFFRGRLRFSGTQQDAPVRLFRRGSVRFVQPVHEEIVTDLPVRRLQHRMMHYSTPDIEHYRRKLRTYLPLEVRWLRQSGRRFSFWDELWRPPLMFIRLYFFELGILDGWSGLIFACLSSYYVFEKYRRAISKQSAP